MVLQSKFLSQNFVSKSKPFMYGKNPVNPHQNNIFSNQQVTYNSSQKNPMNINFTNFAHQAFTSGRSSLNPYIQDFYSNPNLLASSISAPGVNHADYSKNNGLAVTSSSNDVSLYKQYPGFIHPNTSQQLMPPMHVQTRAINPHVNIQEFGSSDLANSCMNVDKIVGDGRAKRNNERKYKNGIKGHWIQEEDRMLLNLVHKYGNKKWSYIARMMPGRLGKQLRERYNNHLKPGLKKGAWTEEEDMQLIRAHEKMGNKWVEISKLLPGRSETDIKNRWNATKRKCINAIQKSKNIPKPSSLFENYMKTMFNNVCQSKSPTSAESNVIVGFSSGGSISKQVGTAESVSVEDYGVSDFEVNVLANNSGSLFESMSYLDMLLQK
ncbi:uncharacterized protein LOC141705795 [Apium graveolens]|uniref:uncharacterized protein LOC141705795 n=1 Tax=Apium graveolens TaxID=4045 RepID=UPI003D7B5E29